MARSGTGIIGQRVLGVVEENLEELVRDFESEHIRIRTCRPESNGRRDG